MNRLMIKDTLVWGFLLWLVGYVLGIVLFMILPSSMIGWVIMPVGIAMTLWVLLKKIKIDSFKNYVVLGMVWVTIAVVLDYFLLVKLFKPADGYYKPDVYLYYLLTPILPLVVGWRRKWQ